MSFADLGISKAVVRALAERDITQPFPVQQLVIRDALAGHDLLVQSPTGSGKTLAFGIPLVDRIEPGGKGLSALVLAPTRELASQIVDELDSIARSRNLQIAAVYGGVGFGPQVKAAQRADIIVATPGRLEDLIARGAINLQAASASSSSTRPTACSTWASSRRSAGSSARRRIERQTLFFSATLEGATGKLAAAYTRDPRHHTHAAPERSEAEIEHRFVHVDSQAAKLDHLAGAAARARRRPHAGLRPHQARRRPSGQAPAQPRTRGGRDARRQEPGPARTRARPLRARRRRSPGRHRRRRPRDRRRRHRPRDQLRRPRRPRLLRAPGRPHRPRRAARRRH